MKPVNERAEIARVPRQSPIPVLKCSKGSQYNFPLSQPYTCHLFSGKCSRTIVDEVNQKSVVGKSSGASCHKADETSSSLTHTGLGSFSIIPPFERSLSKQPLRTFLLIGTTKRKPWSREKEEDTCGGFLCIR